MFYTLSPKPKPVMDLMALQSVLDVRAAKYKAVNDNMLELRSRKTNKNRTIYQWLNDPRTTCSGITEERASAILPAVKELWQYAPLLADNLKQAQAVLRRWLDPDREQKAYALLFGDSVDLPAMEVPWAQRALGQSSSQASKVSPEMLFALMERIYEPLRELICEIELADNNILAQANALLKRVEELEHQAHEVGQQGMVALISARERVEQYAAAGAADPIGAFAGLRQEVPQLVADARAEIEKYQRLLQKYPGLLDRSRAALQQLKETAKTVAASAELCRQKCSEVDQVVDAVAEERIDNMFREVEALSLRFDEDKQAGATGWVEVIRDLEVLCAEAQSLLTQQQRGVTINRAPVTQRKEWQEELPAYLDIAITYGFQKEIAVLYDKAYSLVHSRPTPMVLAAQTVALLLQKMKQSREALGV